MKITALSYGVEIDVDLAQVTEAEALQISLLASKEGVVLLKDQQISEERFNELNHIWGQHYHANIWCNHKKFPIIYRVTNKEVTEGAPGLFSYGELEWHANGLFTRDPEDCVALWCIDPGIDSVTSFACGKHAYEVLKPEIKEWIEDVSVLLSSDHEETFEQKETYKTKLLSQCKELFSNRQRTRDSLDNVTEPSIVTGERLVNRMEKKLVVRHPITGERGLYFPIFSIMAFRGLDQNKISEIDLFDELKECYVGERGKVYHHHWNKRDLILSDQILSLHKRNEPKGVRELYRTAFWSRHGLKDTR